MRKTKRKKLHSPQLEMEDFILMFHFLSSTISGVLLVFSSFHPQWFLFYIANILGKSY